MKTHLACSLYRFKTPRAAIANFSSSVNELSNGSPSRMRMVRRISFGYNHSTKVVDSSHNSCCGARNFFRSLFASLNFDRCHSFLLASSATGSARKRPLLLSYIHFSLNYKLCCYYLYFWKKYTARFTFEMKCDIIN